MSFHSSLVPEADCLERTCSDGDLSDTLNGTTTASGSSLRASETDTCPQPQSSLTCVSSHSPVQPTSTEELRTWLQQVSPVSRFPSPADSEPRETSGTCGPQPRMSFAAFDRNASCWKTCQASLLADTPESSSPIWPRWAMWDGTAAYPLPTPAPVTNEIDGGLWPTPTRKGNYNKPYPGRKSGWGLISAVRMWPTPLKRDSRTVKGAARSPRSLGTEPLIIEVAKAEGLENGRLSPEWTEWLMGFPLGWTNALLPLEMRRFQEWFSQHSPFSQTNKDAT